jgi:hypothetical protein
MPGLVPGIHVFKLSDQKVVDGRDKPGHDGSVFSQGVKIARPTSRPSFRSASA